MDLHETLQTLIRKNQAFYRNLCAKYVTSPVRVEECLQDGYGKFLACGRTFDSLEDAEPFLCRLLVNHFIDAYREEVVRRKHEQALPEDPSVLASGRENPEGVILARQRAGFRQRVIGEICRQIEHLPARQRELVHLAFLKEPPLTLREISEQKRIPLTTLHSRLRGAVKTLRGRSADLLQEWENYL